MKVRHRQIYYAISLLFSDFFMILAAFAFSFWLKFESGLLPSPFGTPDILVYERAFGIVVLIMLFVFRAHGLYLGEKIPGFLEEFTQVFKAVSTTTLLLVAATFFFRDFSFSRGFLVVAWLNIMLFVIVPRMFLGFLYLMWRRARNKFNDVLIIGASLTSARYANHHKRDIRLCTRIVGFLDKRYPSLKKYKRYPIWGTPDDLQKVLTAQPHINEVVVTQRDLSHERVVEIMTVCEKHLVSFKWLPDIMGLMAAQMNFHYEFGMPLLYCKETPLLEWENRLLKRFMDLLLASVGLVVVSPLLVLLAIVIKLDSKGPVIYRQERVGEDGKTFDLLKFRTMAVDAEKETGPVWAKDHDSRRTRTGSFLRRSNFDELPQLWNVMKGDMSLVGPRPERPHFVGQFREGIPRYMGRHHVKSGITGWAQVNGLRGNTSIEERTKYDLYYLENWSIFLDLKILFKTIFAFKNAY
jgi:exopolysaccharide biosynthesis polyprenyl glycosylphosphotransferase